MSDVPDDLPSVGRHHGNQPPEETGQTVSSPEGPDPSAGSARPTPALFRLMRPDDDGDLRIQAYSPRADVPSPEDVDEVGRHRTKEALREALATEDIDGWTGVFEDAEAGRVLTDEVTPAHPWIGNPRYPVITLFADADAATAYADRTTVTTDSPPSS